MKNRVKNKWVCITGATSGIGEASARLFAKYESNLLLTGRREKRLRLLKSELQNDNVQVEYRPFDIRDRQSCKSFVDSLEFEIDILINNAGLAKGMEAVFKADLNNWQEMIDTNLNGLLYITRYVSEKMKKRNSGHIINIGSTSGYETYAGGSVYSATKYAVRAITGAVKKDFHGTNVRVSSVSPGLVNTEFSEVRFDGDKNMAESVYRGMKPLSAIDVAEIILFTANRPDHVNIVDTIVYPVSQSAATMVHRDNE